MIFQTQVSCNNSSAQHLSQLRIHYPLASSIRPASSPLNAEARQPTASARSISPPHLGLHPPPTMRSCLLKYVAPEGCNCGRKCRIPHISPPPPEFCTRLRLQQWGRICRTLRYYIPLATVECNNRLIW